MDIQKIIDLWMKLKSTKKEDLGIFVVDRNRTAWDWQINEDMKTAFELDPDGLTALLLLDNFREDFFTGCAVSINDVIHNPNFPVFVKECKELTDMLSAPEIVKALEEFVHGTTKAVNSMNANREEVQEMLDNRYDMAILRRDALWSMEKLSMHQFFQGDTATDHLAYLPDIHVFWNMNSLIRCAWQSPDGVSVNLVIDPLLTSSYFAFVAKNGTNLTVLTDKTKEAHPTSKYMSRRPERDFTRRIFSHHFPYGLMDISMNHKGDYIPSNTQIVPLQDKPIKIGTISNMLPDEIIWTVMMFALIDQKLYKNNYHCEKLSYTSDMIADPAIAQKLLEANKTAGTLMVKEYKPLMAPVLAAEDTESDSQYTQYPATNKDNGWLYERYKSLIPSELMNGLLPGSNQRLFLLENNTLFLADEDRWEEDVFSKKTVLKADPKDYQKVPREFGYTIIGETTIKSAVKVDKMTGDEFGTEEELMRDYRWYARHNIALFINKKAREEFEERKKEVCTWVNDRIRSNVPRFYEDMVKYALDPKNAPEVLSRIFLKPYDRDWHDWFYSMRLGVVPAFVNAKDGNHWSYPANNARCYFSDAPCSYMVYGQAYNINDLLYLTGCTSVEELPDVLRHWRNGRYSDVLSNYTGNCILERIDPIDWVVENPWNTLEFNILIGVGKKYLKGTAKEMGLAFQNIT